MEKSIPVADAKRNFSAILRAVKDGQTYVVTSHGIPIARIMPAHRHRAVAAAKRRLFARLRAQPVRVIGEHWHRDELYDD